MNLAIINMLQIKVLEKSLFVYKLGYLSSWLKNILQLHSNKVKGKFRLFSQESFYFASSSMWACISLPLEIRNKTS